MEGILGMDIRNVHAIEWIEKIYGACTRNLVSLCQNVRLRTPVSFILLFIQSTVLKNTLFIQSTVSFVLLLVRSFLLILFSLCIVYIISLLFFLYTVISSFSIFLILIICIIPFILFLCFLLLI
jgi:hypothetical protein